MQDRKMSNTSWVTLIAGIVFALLGLGMTLRAEAITNVVPELKAKDIEIEHVNKEQDSKIATNDKAITVLQVQLKSMNDTLIRIENLVREK